jgi:replication initiation and membrane attachment protein DnaB
MGIVEQDKELLRLETMDPVEFLSRYAGGKPVPKQLVQMIQELRHRYAFPNGVINGLLEYCLLENNYQIERTMVMELADELREAGVQSGREAFTHLKSLEWGEEEEEDMLMRERDFPYNPEYVETNIALIARQLHELRKDVQRKFQRMNQQLDQIERKLEKITDMLK